MFGKKTSVGSIKGVRFVGAFVLGLLVFSQVGLGAVVSFSPKELDAKIFRNGSSIATPLFSDSITGVSAPYNYIQEIFQDTSIAHSGAAVGSTGIYQHLFAYSLPNSTATYDNVNNITGHTRKLVITPEESSLAAGRRVWAKSDITLDGFMLLAKGEQEGASYKGMNAKFEVNVTLDKEKLSNGITKLVQTPVFKGTVTILGKKNGKIKFSTTGNLNSIRKYIEITDEGDSYRLDFDQIKIPYKVLTKVGQEYSLTTTVASLVTTTGKGSGAEVKFGPGGPVLPDFIENGQVPEPATITFLLVNSLALLRFRRKHT